jgi:transmembrane sensor
MGPDSISNERIVLQAARWYARLAAPDCTGEERAEFERWRQQDPAHAEVYAATEAFCASIGPAAPLDDRLQAMADEAFAMGAADDMNELADDGSSCAEDESHGGIRRFGASTARDGATVSRARRWYLPAALAATVVVAFVGVRLALLGESAAPPAVTYAAPSDSRRDVMLPDGSVVHLDVASEISVRMSGDKRDIVLVDGRALFEVAHDASRPFTVAAGRARTTALGTRFQVQREGQRVLVTLAEGSVAVTGDATPMPWREKLIPGEQISLTTDAQRGARRTVDAQMVTSWSRGRLVFRSTPLSEALEEVNRYGDRKIRLGDPELAQMPVGGNFIAGETDLIVSAFAAALPLRVVDGGAGEIILFRRYKVDVP